ncbi:MAG: hypothetical protein BAJATHORv1_110052 [Candidatus Thorarchaeota archaeon]|nr:MAG: hypothetical protein BAJATHORv1_110052 [Candidatus Thorarchaeota archaeon]
MFHALRTYWKPEMYQGRPEMNDYFEGWYFKLVDKDRTNSYAIIPGVSFGGLDNSRHSFIQVLTGNTASATYHRFPISSFESAKHSFHVRIDENTFSLDKITLSVNNDEQQVEGELHFSGIIPWPVNLLSPGAMGLFRFIPGMQCLHGILSFDHQIEGKMIIDGSEIDFTGGRGYLEKDWGQGFPTSWIWMQSNHFREEGISFTSSIATIPWFGTEFAGFLIGLLYGGKVYRFTTYTGARLSKIQVSEKNILFQVHDKNHAIVVNASRADGATLRSPVRGSMSGRIIESLTAEIGIRFYELTSSGRRLLFEGTGTNAGLEVVGDMTSLGAVEI